MLRKWMTLALLLAAVLLCPRAGAETVTVSPGALGQALASARDGDVLVLSEGTYGEPEEVFPLTVTARVTICAAEGARPVIDAPAFRSALQVEATGVTIRGLEIRFRRTGLYLLGDDVTVEDCSILLADTAWRTSSCGSWFGGIRRATFRNCDFTDCGICMAGPPLSERSKELPVLTGLFEVGEEKEFFTTHELTDCTVNGRPLYYAVEQDCVSAPSDAGEIIIADCGEVLVQGADVSRASMGMEIVYCDHVRVENSRADLCGVFGIYFAKLAAGEMVECSSEGTNHGLDIRACSDITLLRCRADNCDQGLFFSRVINGLMKDCTVTSTGQGYFMAGGTGCQIDSCTAIGCENGFNIQKEQDVLVTNCILRECTICAVRLDGSPTVFVGNVMENNWVGVMAYGEVPFVLACNSIRGSGSCGLYLRDIARSRICGNVIADNGNHSVEASGNLRGTLFIGNTMDTEPVLSGGAVLPMAENIIG